MKNIRLAVMAGALGWATLVVVPAPSFAQASGSAVASAEAWPEADPEDVASIDAIIAALYDVISGPAGEKRDWDRFRSLMNPQARLIPTGSGPNGQVGHVFLGVDDYVARAGASLEANGFFEVEAARTTEQWGQIAHAFSTYESRNNADDAEPFDRGINSIQLLDDGERWWIMNVFWAAESSGLTLPERYLKSRRPKR
ncbi:MAG: hypothetical protein OEU54_14460 [Gemmatimonadota bacterium]|nr:hypothetical protein [Gemmatimonadota bacterium]